MTTKMNARRPASFHLTQIRMPVGALTSITHRLTGILLAIGVPFAVYLLDSSLESPRGYARVIGWFDRWQFRFLVIVFVWALAHHLMAGIRHLLSDIDIGSSLPAARRSAWIVNLCGLAIALLAARVLI